MPIAAFLLALVAGVLGQLAALSPDRRGSLGGALGAERAGFAVFATGTFAVAVAIVDVAAHTHAWLPPGALFVGWVLLRAWTRKDQPATRPRLGALAVLVAVAVAEAVARMSPG